MMTKLEWALDAARRGFRVFPLADNGKTPRKGFDNWQHVATTDPDQITRWWKQWPAANIGGVIGDNVVVYDEDPRNGGEATLQMFQMTEEWPETLTQRTQSGGHHFFFKGQGFKKTIIGQGADFLSQNCYVLLPGSTIDGRTYEWINDVPMADAPPWMDRFKPKPNGKANGHAAIDGLETEHEETVEALNAARQWIAKVTPTAHQGARNSVAYQVAARLYDFGLAEATVFSLLCDWNVTHCYPPLEGDEIEHIATSGKKYRQNPIGSARVSDGHGFEAVKEHPDIPLTIAEWQSRELANPDFILGDWLTTTTRGLLVAATGLGKTNFAMAMAMAVAAGEPFLHWEGRRPAKVLYVDGEMSRRLLRARIDEAVRRLGSTPEGFYAFNHEDMDGFAPLDTKQGQNCIETLIQKIGQVDFIVFDSVMCLTHGDMKEEESWRQTLPWARSLTKRNIGQIWIHHTGHDTTRSYGTSTREWQMDTVIILEENKRDDTDLTFVLKFPKARERTPENRKDFFSMEIALVMDHWCTNRILSDVIISEKAKQLYSLLKQNAHGQMPTENRKSGQTPKTWQAIVEIIEEILPKKRWTRQSVNRWLEELAQNKMVKKVGKNQWVI